MFSIHECQIDDIAASYQNFHSVNKEQHFSTNCLISKAVNHLTNGPREFIKQQDWLLKNRPIKI